MICKEDLQKMRIPDGWVLALAGAGFLRGAHLRPALLPLLLFCAVALLCALLRLQMPYGLGDAKLLSAFALIGGTDCLLCTYVCASLAAGAASLLLLLLHKKEKRDRIPFGPFLVFGFLFYRALSSAMLQSLQTVYQPLTSAM